MKEPYNNKIGLTSGDESKSPSIPTNGDNLKIANQGGTGGVRHPLEGLTFCFAKPLSRGSYYQWETELLSGGASLVRQLTPEVSIYISFNLFSINI